MQRGIEIARDALANLRYVLNLITLGRPPDAGEIEYLRTVCDNQENELNALDQQSNNGET